MNILHATTDPTLLARLKEMLASANRADIAVGYLFVSGFDAVSAELARLNKVRILVGRTDRETLEEIARGLQQAEALQARLNSQSIVQRSARSEIAGQAIETVAEGIARLPQTDEAVAGVKRLCDMVSSGQLEIRTYPRSMLHAKAYICWYDNHAEPGSAIVGSSNFTLAGFTGNTELNVRVTGDAEMSELGRWFEALWVDSVDVTQDIAVELKRSWALAKTPPYHVYLKALYELYRDELEAPELEPRRSGLPELANFQLDAVRRGRRMVDLHGGCFIGDVVGLGKTYIGAELVRQLQFTEPRGRHPLIVCPAGLVPMWEVVNEKFGLGAEVISMSMIAPPPTAVFDEETGTYETEDQTTGGINLVERYPNRGVVLVDEAHNFRHDATRRYQGLSEYLVSGEHKVVLLSATPQNLGPADIYHQLRVFLDDLDHSLDLEPLQLRDYFRCVQRWYEYRIDVENWNQDYLEWQARNGKPGVKPTAPPPAPVQPSEPFATIEQVLVPVFVRRRRKDIRELYGDGVVVNGVKVRFPDPRLENLPYRLDKVYAKAGSLLEIQNTLARHRGARYLAAGYLRPEARTKSEYRDLLRARNRVASLVRHLMFKRLESSIAAFRSTLEVLIRSNKNFRASLDAGFVPIGTTATAALAGEAFDVEELLERLTREEERREAAGTARSKLRHPVDDFDVAAWAVDLDTDLRILEGLESAIVSISPDDDDKLRELRKFMERPEVASGKLLIFSEAETTVEYLFEQLNPGGKDPSIERLSGGSRAHLQEVIKRFAPTSNLKAGERMPGPPVRVLIATDVVSEGQNLQDCNRVLNYDLHWNPVRLIQRFGRIDRIGTTHDTIYLYNTWPDTDLDVALSLTDRLQKRIQAFHDFIGLDTQLLSKSERVNPGAMYRIYEERRLPDEDDVLDEVSSFQRGISLLQELQREDPDLWKAITALPDGIRSAFRVGARAETEAIINFQKTLFESTVQLPLGSPRLEAAVQSPLADPQPGDTVVLLKTGDRASAYAVGTDFQPRQITAAKFVSAVACDPDTPLAALPADINARVMAAYAAIRAESASRLGRARRPSTDTRVRRYVSRELRAAREAYADNTEELRRIDTLRQIFLDHLPASVTRELQEVQRMQLTGNSLIRRLDAMRERHRLVVQDLAEPAEPGTAEAEVVRIICSDGLRP